MAIVSMIDNLTNCDTQVDFDITQRKYKLFYTYLFEKHLHFYSTWSQFSSKCVVFILNPHNIRHRCRRFQKKKNSGLTFSPQPSWAELSILFYWVCNNPPKDYLCMCSSLNELLNVALPAHTFLVAHKTHLVSGSANRVSIWFLLWSFRMFSRKKTATYFQNYLCGLVDIQLFFHGNQEKELFLRMVLLQNTFFFFVYLFELMFFKISTNIENHNYQLSDITLNLLNPWNVKLIFFIYYLARSCAWTLMVWTL